MKYSLLSILCLLIFSCDKSADSANNQTPLFKKDPSPEEVVKLWQNYMDKNLLEEAKAIGTESTINFLGEIQDYFQDQEMDSLTTLSEIRRIKCSSKKTKATCFTAIRDVEYDEVYNDTFYLNRENGKWLIDIHEK